MSPIKSLDYFVCGYCRNQQALLFRHLPKKDLVFPAGVFLIYHEKLGYILYDTGYDAEVMGKHLKYRLYRLPNPITMSEEAQIDQQLEARGISPDQIAYVLVSHLHPDHIGRLKAFKQATFILTEGAYQTYLKPKLRDLVFKEYFPEDFEQRMRCLKFEAYHTFLEKATCDIFGDGSFLAIELDGHARGQLCVYLPEKKVLLAADSLWQWEMIDVIDQMKKLPRLIQNDFTSYQQNVPYLKKLHTKGVAILVSHEEATYVREVLGESSTIS